jgi:transcriptional pleiotropic regulator of transition state genes
MLTENMNCGKNFWMKVVKVNSKGWITIPVEVRSALGIDENTYLKVSRKGNEIRIRKVVPVRPLSNDDPIWDLIGAGESGFADVAEEHERRRADGETER